MIPYGIIYRLNKRALQQSYIVWQKKYGLLSPKKFISVITPMISVFYVIFCAASVIFDKEINLYILLSDVLMNGLLLAILAYLDCVKAVREYAVSMNEENIQLVLKENELEITTAFSKEIVPYSEIDFCIEKDFLLTVITDKNTFPLSVPKMSVLKGNYDNFTSLLKSKVSDRYRKKGDN